MATTTNFGWTTPNDTDLVKDGAAAIRTLGSSIDTSFVDLKGGTTGQVLAKASDTDLDYAWTTSSAGSMTAIASGNLPTGTGTLSLTSISGSYTHLEFHATAWNTSTNSTLTARLNGDTGSNYSWLDSRISNNTPAYTGSNNQTLFLLNSGSSVLSGNNKNITIIRIPFYTNATTAKIVTCESRYVDTNTTRALTNVGGYYYGTNAAVTQLDFISSSNWAGGSYVLYGVK